MVRIDAGMPTWYHMPARGTPHEFRAQQYQIASITGYTGSSRMGVTH